MKKKIRNSILILAFIGAILVGLIYVNNNYYPIWNSNTIQVSTGKSYTVEKVKIEFGIGAGSINRKNDQALFKKNNGYKIVYENGRVQSNIDNEYGENDFLLTYNDNYYLTFRHFKFNRKAQHDYSFTFLWNEGGLCARVKIDGDYPMKFERRMIPIDSASFYRCNVLVEDAGTIFNGIELK
ncbi:MAG: hypothetical protein ACFHU9_08885 [Fluviicola sp.]